MKRISVEMIQRQDDDGDSRLRQTFRNVSAQTGVFDDLTQGTAAASNQHDETQQHQTFFHFRQCCVTIQISAQTENSNQKTQTNGYDGLTDERSGFPWDLLFCPKQKRWC